MMFTKKGQVLDLGAGGEWDDAGVFSPSVLYKDNVFYMYYTGYDGSNRRLGLATSSDGVTFTKKGQVLDLGAGGAWDDGDLLNGGVIYKNNQFNLYYFGHDGSDYRIGLATSKDGLTFTKQGQVFDPSIHAAITAYFVMKVNIRYINNIFYLYLTDDAAGHWKISLATSKDGLTFTDKGLVLTTGASGAWDDVRVTQPSVIYKNNLYYMFYSGYDGSNHRIGLATSKDGITFTKQGQVLDLGAGGAWDDVHLTSIDVIYKDNLFMLYYAGYCGSIYRIGLAVSIQGGIPLTPDGFRENAATGTATDPEHINDNNTASDCRFYAINQYVEISFSGKRIIKQYRQMGNNHNAGDGFSKIQYWNGSSWIDWITNIATQFAAVWSAWSAVSVVKTDKIRIVATALDTDPTPDKNYINEWEMKY